MGSKVEYILLGLIVLTIAFVTVFKPSLEVKDKNFTENKKVSQINDFTEYEINATNLLHTLKAKEAWQIDKSWYLKEPVINSSEVKELKSKEALYSEDKIVFEKDVKLLREDNLSYSSNKVIYYTKKRELVTPKEFNITKNQSMVFGEDLIYDVSSKETKAKKVRANIKLKESKE